MIVISKKEEGAFLKLFISAGYILDFLTSSFDIFTEDSIGVAVCATYHLSKGKSLVTYLNKASDFDRTKLLTDLFSYYEEKMEYECNRDYNKDRFVSRYDEEYARQYQKCKAILNSHNEVSSVQQNTVERLKTVFSSSYMSQQIDLMLRMQVENPTEAIGKSKELIESCCKTILEEMGIPWG